MVVRRRALRLPPGAAPGAPCQRPASAQAQPLLTPGGLPAVCRGPLYGVWGWEVSSPMTWTSTSRTRRSRLVTTEPPEQLVPAPVAGAPDHDLGRVLVAGQLRPASAATSRPWRAHDAGAEVLGEAQVRLHRLLHLEAGAAPSPGARRRRRAAPPAGGRPSARPRRTSCLERGWWSTQTSTRSRGRPGGVDPVPLHVLLRAARPPAAPCGAGPARAGRSGCPSRKKLSRAARARPAG